MIAASRSACSGGVSGWWRRDEGLAHPSCLPRAGVSGQKLRARRGLVPVVATGDLPLCCVHLVEGDKDVGRNPPRILQVVCRNLPVPAAHVQPAGTDESTSACPNVSCKRETRNDESICRAS